MAHYTRYEVDGAPAPKRRRRGAKSAAPASRRSGKSAGASAPIVRGAATSPVPSGGAGPARAPSRAGGAPPSGSRLWATWLRVILIIIVAVISGTVGIAYGWAQGQVRSVQSKDPGAVSKAKRKLAPALPGQPVNILFLGADHAGPGDPGRSDSLMLVRLDPQTKSISMLSVPRDLWVSIPGYGMNKINAAYSFGGPALSVQTFTQVTGLPVNHFVRADFSGFWRLVNALGGVYLQVDHRYFAYTADDQLPGYQRLNGTQALRFVRFRHDQYADFGRMQRQQLFLRELQRQSKRWRDWAHLPRLIRAVARMTVSDISSMRQLLSLASMVLQLDTSHIYQTHIEGDTPMIGAQSVVTATADQIHAAVETFLNPTQPPLAQVAVKVPNSAFPVRVLNGNGQSGVGASVAAQLSAIGYHASSAGNADAFTYTSTVIYATKPLLGNAQHLAAALGQTEIKIVPRTPTTLDGVTVVVGSLFGGQVIKPVKTTTGPPEHLLYNSTPDLANWRTMKSQSKQMTVMMPTVWATGFTFDSLMPFRAYTVVTDKGIVVPAVVAVGQVPASVDPKQGAFDIQEIRWSNVPALSGPTRTQVIHGRRYLLYYDSAKLHMVAWKIGPSAYWVTNTLDDALSNDFMLALATSFKPVK